MKILFQGGWKAGRNDPGDEPVIAQYCRALAERVVGTAHTIVLTSDRDCDQLLAEEVSRAAAAKGVDVKRHLTFLLPNRYKTVPKLGRVVRVPQSAWWIEERTYFVRECDAVIAVGGGRGSLDCVEKAILAQKPVFVARSVHSVATRAREAHGKSFAYLQPEDESVLDDVSVKPAEWVDQVFAIVDRLAASRYSRRIFVVHGRNHARRDELVSILRRLDFEPVVLEEQHNGGLTIIEKLERDTQSIGYAFVLYDPDDVGGLGGQPASPRARQNVVFEHGLLIGLLGRDRTCAILAAGVEPPSDISGMIYETMPDIGQSGIRIATVLKHAGYGLSLDGLVVG